MQHVINRTGHMNFKQYFPAYKGLNVIHLQKRKNDPYTTVRN